MRGTFSLYAGWLTAATILNTSIVFRAYGLKGSDIEEENLTIVILWVAFAIYNARSYMDWNPLYGSVFIWVIMAIYYTQITTYNSEYPALMKNCIIIAIVHGISMVVEWTYLLTGTYYDLPTAMSTEGGIFYGDAL